MLPDVPRVAVLVVAVGALVAHVLGGRLLLAGFGQGHEHSENCDNGFHFLDCDGKYGLLREQSVRRE